MALCAQTVDPPPGPGGACLSRGPATGKQTGKNNDECLNEAPDTTDAVHQQFNHGPEVVDTVSETKTRRVDIQTEEYSVCYPPCDDQLLSVPQASSGAALPFRMFGSCVAKQLTNEHLEQIQFIVKGYFPRDLVPTFSNGHDAVEYLITTHTIDEQNVLFLQLLCAAIDNPHLIDYVHKWAEHKGNVLHFYPPVTCSYDWKFSGPLKIKGEPFKEYPDKEVGDKRMDALRMLSSIVELVSDGHSSEHVPANPRIQIVQHKLSSELIIHPEFGGLCRADNTIPKRYDTAENVNLITDLTRENTNMKAQINELTESNEALTHKINQLHNSIRLQEYEEKIINEQHEAIEELRAKLTELTNDKNTLEVQIKELIDSNESLTTKGDILRETIRLQEDKCNVLNQQREEFKVLGEKLSDRDKTIAHLEKLVLAKTKALEKIEENLQYSVKAAVDSITCEKEELKRQIGILKLIKETLMVRVGKLEDDIEMKDISLSNERNNKTGRFELDNKLQAISRHSLSVRKACGIFDPGSMPIPSSYTENFKHSFTNKVVRVFPQTVDRTNVRVSRQHWLINNQNTLQGTVSN